jgi:DNA polymerase
LVIADFAGIEARGVAWCAGEQRQLDLFAEGGDNYCDLASIIFGRQVTAKDKIERGVGKIAVLGCNYGMGHERFETDCVRLHVDLAAANTSARAVVEAYRNRYPAIAGRKVAESNWRDGGLWKDFEVAVRRTIRTGKPTFAGKCNFIKDGTTLAIELPSGRRMYYQNARIERLASRYANDSPDNMKPSIVFDSPKYRRTPTYGGKLTENIVSGTCRDLLVEAMLECERQSLPVVLHVHDEVVIEVEASEGEEALRRLLTIMSTPPSWATGFPIEVEGFLSDRYFKGAPSGEKPLRARNREILE